VTHAVAVLTLTILLSAKPANTVYAYGRRHLG